MSEKELDDLQKHIQERLQDPEFRKYWEESEAEYQKAKAKLLEKRSKTKKSRDRRY